MGTGASNPRAKWPDEAVEHVARQVGVPAADVGSYDWSGHPRVVVGRSCPAQAGAGSLTLVVLSTTASMKP
jgi:hypothetical protein